MNALHSSMEEILLLGIKCHKHARQVSPPRLTRLKAESRVVTPLASSARGPVLLYRTDKSYERENLLPSLLSR